LKIPPKRCSEIRGKGEESGGGKGGNGEGASGKLRRYLGVIKAGLGKNGVYLKEKTVWKLGAIPLLKEFKED